MADRTYKAPVAEYNNRLTYDRFKYAEETAHDLDDAGHAWVMFRDVDVIERDEYPDGTYETYTVKQFVVLWNE
jgi:uncharacterized protein YecT (DUF1311 family)